MREEMRRKKLRGKDTFSTMSFPRISSVIFTAWL